MSVSDMKTTILVLLYTNNLDHLLMKEFLLNFEGHWRDCNKNGLPTYPGIYMVYRCQYDEQNNKEFGSVIEITDDSIVVKDEQGLINIIVPNSLEAGKYCVTPF